MVINTINPHSYAVSKHDHEFQIALNESDILIPDGIGIVLAVRWLWRDRIDRITGYDLFIEMVSTLNGCGSGRVLFVGSTLDVLGAIQKKLSSDFSNITPYIYSPPYKESFNSDDIENIRNEIAKVRPDIVFYGLTAPKQEKMINAVGKVDGVKVMSGIGAVFDFYAGKVGRPADFWCALGIEWLVRLLGEPKRLWKRTLVSAPVFMFDLVREVFSKRVLER
ncbi:WecB/TagA/CpsF family glycosyltransferase [Teredinibacter sp. KSP-S5-2]|uniref:WecB/TagA/CpsF family glycosyltransferase n=1 Tax=Teredinibacter sp. KSP-S5-2 TaxID=3034506 RepID=UPI0029348901|nr:WecB/TagA/CpsF family glycosyltransferase [Teredinibacter sp. KSP-S5-2]WNO07853.1 WecB/TagA/CpsF family glycosyltransferase [Teredinibacter sp. KSP-S5-2]